MKIVKLFGVFLLLTTNAIAKNGENKKPSEIPKVFFQKIEKGELYNPVSFGGFIEAKDQRPVGSEISGTVNEVFVSLGQKVSRGQVLFNLRPQGAGQDYRLNKVRSPISGVVIEVIHDPGKFIQAGEGVVKVADPRHLKVEINITYDDLQLVTPGKEVSVLLTGHEKKEIRSKGIVTSVSPSAHPELGTFPVEVDIHCEEGVNCSKIFRIGTFVRTIFKSNLREGIKIDAKYLVNQRRKAIIIEKGNLAKFVEVKLGDFLGTEVEILSGLKPGDRVVTNYSKFPKEGEKLILTNKSEEKKKIYSSGGKKKPVGKS